MDLGSALYHFGATLGWTLVHFLWQGLMIGAIYAVARAVWPSVQARYRAATIGLFASLALPALTFQRLWSNTAAAAPLAETTVAPAPVLAAEATATITPATASTNEFWLVLLATVWLCGALAILARLLGDWRDLRRVIRESLPAPAELVAVLDREVARIGLRRRVQLCLTSSYNTPGVYGIVRPVILLPVSLLLKLPTDQIEALIIHELAHVRRLDAIGNIVAILARTLLYFHPVVHWLCRDLERTRESLCDDMVLRWPVDRLKYARALNMVAMFQRTTPAPLLTANGGELTSRLRHVLALETTAEPRRRGQIGPLLMALAVIGLSVLGLRGLPGDAGIAATRPEVSMIAQMVAPALLRPAPDAGIAPIVPVAPVLHVPETAAPAVEMATTAALTASATPDTATMAATDSPDPGQSAPVATMSAPSDTVTAPIDTIAATTATDTAGSPAPTLADANPAAADTAPAIDRVQATPAIVEQPPATTPAAAPGRPEVARIVHPSYPSQARRQGVEGSITLSYRIDASGSATDIQVVAAEPSDVFDAAAIQALARWRFDQTSGTGDARFMQAFDFTLPPGEQRCADLTGTRICRR